MDEKRKKNLFLHQTFPLNDLQEQLKNAFKLPEIITNSPSAELTKMFKQFKELGKVSNLIPQVSTKSIIPTLSDSQLYDSITVLRSPTILPLSIPDKFHIQFPNPSAIIPVDEVYEDKTFPERGTPPLEPIPIKTPKKVIIVGGSSDGTNQIVARFVKKLGLKVIILDEQPNGGRTNMEKLEAYAYADFAIVLLTPDDVGAPKDHPNELKPRPSQNTIFEFVYFLRELQPEQVCTLYKAEIELPSYIDGRIHVSMDNDDGWKLKLLREMEYAGLSIDLNKFL